jgi:hypothetical protein
MVTLPFHTCPRIMTNRSTIAAAAAARPAATRPFSNARFAPGLTLVLIGVALSACAPAEPPERAELRARLKQETRLSEPEVGRLCDEVAHSVEGKGVRITVHGGTETPEGDQRAEVFSLLRDRAGVYDEGLKREGEATYRVLNGPGKSNNAEVEATQRLWVDIETLRPHRYEFTYAFQGYGDYAYDLAVER